MPICLPAHPSRPAHIPYTEHNAQACMTQARVASVRCQMSARLIACHPGPAMVKGNRLNGPPLAVRMHALQRCRLPGGLPASIACMLHAVCSGTRSHGALNTLRPVGPSSHAHKEITVPYSVGAPGQRGPRSQRRRAPNDWRVCMRRTPPDRSAAPVPGTRSPVIAA